MAQITLNTTGVASNGSLVLQSNGTTAAVTVDTSQNVGIGTASPAQRLNVATASGNCYTRVDRASQSTGQVGYQWGGGTSSTDWLVYLPASSNDLTFFGNSAERMRLNTNGNLVLQGGTTTASGIGITFPATQSASSNANTLDDYEEGTFTPTCTLAVPGTSTTGGEVGVYTKVGNLVTVTGRLTFTKGTGTGDLSFGGLPFTSTSTTTYQNSGALSLDSVGVAGKVYYFLLVNSSTAPALVSVTQAGGAVAVASATDLGVSGAGIRYMFSYQTA